jgi:septum formation protein
MQLRNIQNYKIILASNSPRRQELLRLMAIPFEVRVKPVDEVFPANLSNNEVAIFLAQLKSNAFGPNDFEADELLITADTIVCLGKQILTKPNDRGHAIEMLKKLSGKKHQVITGVCLRTKEKSKSFAVSTSVYFRELSLHEIVHYVHVFEPFDKAGAYAIQEWIGIVGIKKINGSYFNVVGLPTEALFEALTSF